MHTVMRTRIIILAIITAVLMFAATIRAADQPAASRPSRSSATLRDTIAPPPAPKPERVTFTTDEKSLVTIVGSYYAPSIKKKGTKAPIAILLHMYGQDRTTWEPLIPYLHAAGFAALAIDMRGHGESVTPASLELKTKMEDRDPRLFREMHRDVEAAYLWLSRRLDIDRARFVLVGASVGCSVALDYAARDKSVDGVVCMTPGTDYLGLNSIADARKYGERSLLMLASEEERGAADELGRIVPRAVVRIVAAAGLGKLEGERPLHGTRMFGEVDGIEQTIVDFLVKAAGPPAESPVIASTLGEVYYEPGSSQADRLSPDNLRYFSSAVEAEARGYRPPKRRTK